MIKFKKIEHNVEELFPSVTTALKSDNDVIIAYLFGSFAKGRSSPLSDVDIAILLDDKYPKDRYWNMRIKLYPKVTKLLKTDEVDLVILNDANPVLAYNIIKNSKILFVKDKKRKIKFQTRVIAQYLDTRHLRALNLSKMKKRIVEGNFGQ